MCFQVREFFTSQRARVRKFIRLSQEKANRSSSCKEVPDGIPLSSDSNDLVSPVPLDSIAPTCMEQGFTSSQDEVTEDQSDKYFVDNIFNLMRREESFSGQVKLMEWIMQIQNASVLYWYFQCDLMTFFFFCLFAKRNIWLLIVCHHTEIV